MSQESDQPIHVVRVEREHADEPGEQPRAVVFRDSDPHPDDEGPDMNEIW